MIILKQLKNISLYSVTVKGDGSVAGVTALEITGGTSIQLILMETTTQLSITSARAIITIHSTGGTNVLTAAVTEAAVDDVVINATTDLDLRRCFGNTIATSAIENVTISGMLPLVQWMQTLILLVPLD